MWFERTLQCPRPRTLRLVVIFVLVLSAGGWVLLGSGVARAGTSSSPFRLLVEPRTGMQELYSLIGAATSSIDLTMYELSDQTAQADLVAAAARGVNVRVILDRDYDGGSVNEAAYSYLSSRGVQVHWGPSDTIFHEKAFTVDDSVAAIGTGNLTFRYYGTDRDYWLIDSGAADVAAIDATFTSDWAGGPVGSGAPGSDLVWSPGAEPRIAKLISSADHSVDFESEELSDHSVVDALAADARRGVTCEVLMEATPSWDPAFATLEAAGCKVRTYPQTASLYIHAKAIVVDSGATSAQMFVGSQNASVASLTYDRELGVVLSGAEAAPVIDEVASVFAHDFTGASADAMLSKWAGRHRRTLSNLAVAARSFAQRQTAQTSAALDAALEKATRASTPPSTSAAWRTALKGLGSASAAYRRSPGSTRVDARRGLDELSRWARALVRHDVRFGNTVLVAMGLPRASVRSGTPSTSPPTGAPGAVSTTTTTTTTAPPPPPPPATTAPLPPTTTTVPSPAATACSPLSDEGTCYEPGEYCRDATHGVTGRAGDGETIVCRTDDGWRWEPVT